ncbi:hypothetical protein BDA96_08G017400 [Sorghum bicolor]|uniref:Major facilitator superfamily (MFS) profile domain-containing protein n=3 Tax=Sorghum bicolor TaxID=4558 RepID=A0A921QCK1_SORBI|nr:hypothetical protein BDA96_08G017400 [Sorghum bicolor]KXG22846.1 hypothetical protein SORBI_3008G015800 [Sorghum bicolor]
MAGGGEAPLLEGKPRVYFDGCPGCANDRRKAENLGIPYGQFFHIWIIILVSCLPISLLFPFIYFMIRDLHIAERVEGIGFYAGFVGASYMLGRALTSTAWGMIADRIGRKPVIILSIISTLLFNTLFGLSVNYWMAIATRFLLGSLNGLLGPIRAYAVEVCRTEHQAIGLTLVSTSWAIGLIIGPAIGGYLAQETLHKHKLHKTEDQGIEDFAEQQNSSTTNKSLLKNWPLMSSIILFCVTSFDDMAYTEIFSLWAESDKKYGGLGFSSEDVGQVLAVTGASILLYQTFVYPRIVKVLGPVNASRIAAILSMVLLFTYPPMTHLSKPWLSVVVNIASMLKNNLVVTVVTCSFILQNNSVPQEQRATANGLATTLMSFFKAFAPAGAGIVFSWAQKRQHAFLFPGDQMVFFLLDIVIFVELIWTFKPFLAIPEQIPRS